MHKIRQFCGNIQPTFTGPNGHKTNLTINSSTRFNPFYILQKRQRYYLNTNTKRPLKKCFKNLTTYKPVGIISIFRRLFYLSEYAYADFISSYCFVMFTGATILRIATIIQTCIQKRANKKSGNPNQELANLAPP